MADYSGAYEKMDIQPKKKGKHADPIESASASTIIKGTLATGGLVSNGSVVNIGGYGAQNTQRVSKRTVRSSRSYDESGNLTFEESEEVIEYAPAFQVTNVTQNSTTGEVE